MNDPNDTYSRKTIETMFELHQERNTRQLEKALAEIKTSLGDIKTELTNSETRLTGVMNKHEAVLAIHMNWVIGVVGALAVTIVGGLVISYLQAPHQASTPTPAAQHASK